MFQKVMSPTTTDSKSTSAEETKTDIRSYSMMQSTENSYLSKKTYEIPLLKDDGSNYTAWKFQQMTVLHMRKLLMLTSGTDKQPTTLSGNDAQDEEKIKAYKETYAKWKQCDDEAFSQIMLNMEDGVMADVVNMTSAHKAWTRIAE
ncbi:hypothetical protein OPQ81_005078 [Rhizoctonia solani]|nr:hypothetical protein OPQ81_005078 [Rhizoctonia solani]